MIQHIMLSKHTDDTVHKKNCDWW